jgi:hypothetical protein
VLEALAQVRGKAVDTPAELEQGVLGRLPRECPYRRTNRLGLGPPAVAGERVQSLQIVVVQVDLERPGHDDEAIRIMNRVSTVS